MAQKSLDSKKSSQKPKNGTRGNCNQAASQTSPFAFFEFIVTCDEKWISFVNDERHGEWRSPGQKPDKRQERTFVQRKQFFDSKNREWYRRGIHQHEEQWKK
uniref:Uncharacterized protein n=1 Tax=Acrobeloides nanus TaxID=290746 RepID=A0A914CEP4_9BILA